ncbi:PREDICTED: tetratricopeptide repeat protein 33 isoform X4 [Lupinus angustifolius]|uniref:tetratricopeptide repeat protein 33 isoform X4 n=1 Tax=Lupinus angustifolius TaxID=3871 RepID=UPI00092E51C5|nr:PREDICTED: tetratricopeptide repeat protein 33 isoform X4 [Lupinus angustifolius]
MKVTWKNKKKKRCLLPLPLFNDKETDEVNVPNTQQPQQQNQSEFEETRHLAKEFQAQGDNLALNGKYREALGKWETAITLAPDFAVLHEQKSQVLLEIGDAWNALKAATRATELEPSWAEVRPLHMPCKMQLQFLEFFLPTQGMGHTWQSTAEFW